MDIDYEEAGSEAEQEAAPPVGSFARPVCCPRKSIKLPLENRGPFLCDVWQIRFLVFLQMME